MERKISLTIKMEPLSEWGIDTSIHAVSCPKEDVAIWESKGKPEDYLVILNTDCSEEKVRTAFIHEMLHLWHDDIRTLDPKRISYLEYQRHKETEEVIKALEKEGAL